MSELADRSTGMFDKIGAGDKQRVLNSELGEESNVSALHPLYDGDILL